MQILLMDAAFAAFALWFVLSGIDTLYDVAAAACSAVKRLKGKQMHTPPAPMPDPILA